MSRPWELDGPWFKLATADGTILGSVTIPREWLLELDRRGVIQFQVPIQVPVAPSPIDNWDPLVSLTIGMLYSSGHHRDALVLAHCRVEEFEKCTGCAFHPGAAFVIAALGRSPQDDEPR